MLHSFGVEDYLALGTGTETWVVEPLLPKGGSALIAGTPKVGKSLLMLGMAHAICHGESRWLSHAVVPGKVLWLQLDMPRSLWQQTQTQLREAGIPPPPGDRFRIVDRESAPYPFNILDPAHAKDLRAEVEAFAPDVVVIDTLRESFRGDENDSNIMQQALSSLEVCTRPAARVYIHHAKKLNPDFVSPMMDRFRGSTFLTGAMDAALFLEARASRGAKDGLNHALFTYLGRAVAETTEHLVQEPHLGYLWRQETATIPLVERLLADDTLDWPQKVQRLSEEEHIPLEAARSRLRRAQARQA